MTYTRARARSLTFLIAVSALIIAALTGCSNTVEDERTILERDGYSNVHILQGETRPYVFSAVVNGCTIALFISQDKEVWIATILTTTDGRTLEEHSYTPGVGTFENVKDEAALRSNQQFAAICPHS
ncbi:MAG: hypothetical protein ABWX90_01185 [Candidatus Saccharimonadales bacterium]